MSVRFRIRTPGGQELSFASQEMFEGFVRSGDLSPDDLVYDAEDGSWAPARTHPIVLEIEYEDEVDDVAEQQREPVEVDAASSEEESEGGSFKLSLAAQEEAPESEASDSPAPEGLESAEAEASPDGSDLGLELAMPEEVSPEEAQRAFVEKLEAERASELDFAASDDGLSGFRMDTTAAALADMSRPEPEPVRQRQSDDPARRDQRDQSRRREAASGGSRRGAGDARERPPTPSGTSGSGAGRMVVVVAVIALAGAGGWYTLRSTGAEGDDVAPVSAPVPDVPIEPIVVESDPEPEPTREPVIARTPAAVGERARERFLTATQAELRELGSIPPAWPGGTYLALPSGAPDVLDVWQSYLTAVRRLRASDANRYRAAYETALDDAVIEGEERGTRLETALADFEASKSAREAHYDRVEALASAAIQTHNALLDVEGLLIFNGSGDGVAAGPIGAGVTARDEDSELLLRQVVELLTATLEAEGLGPRTGDNVRAWVWDGFLDAAAN